MSVDDGVRLGDAAFDRGERAIAQRRHLAELQPVDATEHPGQPQRGLHSAQQAVDEGQLGPLVGGDPGIGESLQRRIVGAAIEAEEPHQPPAPEATADQVHRDLSQPAAHRARLAQRAELLERRHEGVLDDFLGLAAVGEQPDRHGQQAARVPPVQHLAPPPLAGERAPDQLFVADGLRDLERQRLTHENTHSNCNDSRTGENGSRPNW